MKLLLKGVLDVSMLTTIEDMKSNVISAATSGAVPDIMGIIDSAKTTVVDTVVEGVTSAVLGLKSNVTQVYTFHHHCPSHAIT